MPPTITQPDVIKAGCQVKAPLRNPDVGGRT
jgi:hypothetical protein